eukprot:TCONS_00057881-protein
MTTCLLEEGDISYHILTTEHRNEALMVLAHAFCDDPACHALNERPSTTIKIELDDWVEYLDYWMDSCVENGISVVAINVVKYSVVGVMANRHLLDNPEKFLKEYCSMQHTKALTHWNELAYFFEEESAKQLPELREPWKTADLIYLGVHENYRRKNIANNLVRVSLPLFKKAGYKFATLEATNFYTSQIAQRNDFERIHYYDIKTWVKGGETIFDNVKEPHGMFEYWVKRL